MLDGRVLQVRLVEVEAPAAEQALVVHLAAAVLVSPVSGRIELVITKPFTQSKGTSPISQDTLFTKQSFNQKLNGYGAQT